MERRMQEPTTLISSKLSHLPHQMSVWSCSCYLQRFPNTYAPPVLIRPELAFTAVYAYQGLLTINRREGYCSLCFSHPSSLSLLDLPTPHPCQAFTNTFYILAQQSYCETAAFNTLFASLQLLSGQGDQQTQAAKKQQYISQGLFTSQHPSATREHKGCLHLLSKGILMNGRQVGNAEMGKYQENQHSSLDRTNSHLWVWQQTAYVLVDSPRSISLRAICMAQRCSISSGCQIGFRHLWMKTLNYADKFQKMNEHLHSNIIYMQ